MFNVTEIAAEHDQPRIAGGHPPTRRAAAAIPQIIPVGHYHRSLV
jgi:hypothetical protein